ncbi:MAG: MarR family transcriptional regulator [Acidimicrobiales bacterium]|nr:MarR family transcriptional regulator [Acidimicrobiales bacterium]
MSGEAEVDAASARWLDAREQAVWRGYMLMQVRLSAQLNRSLAAGCGLSDGDYAVLVSLSEAPGGRLRAFEVAKIIQWEKSRLSHQLTRMERRGLVERAECPSDARGAFIVITPGGSEAIRRAAPHHVDDVRRWFIDVLSEGQMDALSGIVDAVLSALGEPALPTGCTEAAGDVLGLDPSLEAEAEVC